MEIKNSEGPATIFVRSFNFTPLGGLLEKASRTIWEYGGECHRSIFWKEQHRSTNDSQWTISPCCPHQKGTNVVVVDNPLYNNQRVWNQVLSISTWHVRNAE